MTEILFERKKNGCDWIDVCDPKKEELLELAERFNLHPSSINDCLQPGHLPKYEVLRDYNFAILRYYSTHANAEADTATELTDKTAVFVGKNFIITVHRYEIPFFDKIKTELAKNITSSCPLPIRIFNNVIKACLHSFDEPSEKIARFIDYYEEQIFFKDRKVSLLKALYFEKRKVDVIRRIILLSRDIVDKVDTKPYANTYTRDMRDLYIKLQNVFDSLSENVNHLLDIYFSISAQKTNDTMRVLTIFSVFFMPLTFIVGVYGMNFEHMPELKWHWGYPAVLLLMAVIVLINYILFKRKNWM